MRSLGATKKDRSSGAPDPRPFGLPSLVVLVSLFPKEFEQSKTHVPSFYMPTFTRPTTESFSARLSREYPKLDPPFWLS